MLSCKDVSELVSQSIERRLTRRERWAVQLHLLICAACLRFRRQVEFLHRAARQYAAQGLQAAQQLELSPQARIRIHAALEQERR